MTSKSTEIKTTPVNQVLETKIERVDSRSIGVAAKGLWFNKA